MTIVIEYVRGTAIATEQPALAQAIEHARYCSEWELSYVVGIIEGNEVWLSNGASANIDRVKKALDILKIQTEGELILKGEFELYEDDE